MVSTAGRTVTVMGRLRESGIYCEEKNRKTHPKTGSAYRKNWDVIGIRSTKMKPKTIRTSAQAGIGTIASENIIAATKMQVWKTVMGVKVLIRYLTVTKGFKARVSLGRSFPSFLLPLNSK